MARYVKKMKRKSSRPKRKASTKQFYGKGIRQPVHSYKRANFVTNIIGITPGAVPFGRADNFRLDQIPSFNEFTQLYDQYQIKAVKIQYIPRFTEVTISGTTSTAQIGNIWSCLDYDDSTAPTSIGTVLQYQNVKRTQMNKIHTRYLKPMVATEVFATGIASSYAPKRNIWLDASNASVEHYGVKMWVDSIPASSPPIVFDAVVTYYLMFKNVR